MKAILYVTRSGFPWRLLPHGSAALENGLSLSSVFSVIEGTFTQDAESAPEKPNESEKTVSPHRALVSSTGESAKSTEKGALSVNIEVT
jgi:hypothetical protein